MVPTAAAGAFMNTLWNTHLTRMENMF